MKNEQQTDKMAGIRPGLAKLGVYFAFAYLIIFELLRAYAEFKGLSVDSKIIFSGPSFEVASLFLSPAGLWMTGRTVDGFSSKGKTTSIGPD
ncbi:MAG: hypothetical protein OEY11_12295 [Gammaproteobacteria bacterium]|nr:hypothetical protein [Gammaproteobacteria bacterium]